MGSIAGTGGGGMSMTGGDEVQHSVAVIYDRLIMPEGFAGFGVEEPEYRIDCDGLIRLHNQTSFDQPRNNALYCKNGNELYWQDVKLGSSSGTHATDVKIADQTSEATYYPAFVGDDGVEQDVYVNKSNFTLAIDGSGNLTLACTTFAGALSGNADTATKVYVTDMDTAATYYPTFVSGVTGNKDLYARDAQLKYTIAAGTLTGTLETKNLVFTNLLYGELGTTAYMYFDQPGGVGTATNINFVTSDPSGNKDGKIVWGSSFMAGDINATPPYMVLSDELGGDISTTSFLEIVKESSPAMTFTDTTDDKAWSMGFIGGHTDDPFYLGFNKDLTSLDTSGLTDTIRLICATDSSGVTLKCTFFEGDVTGNVTGDVTGDVTGEITITAQTAYNTYYPTFADANTTAVHGLESHSGLTYEIKDGADNELTCDKFVGDVTGDVTGGVTGDLTGNVTGNVTGNLTGNVTIPANDGSYQVLEVAASTNGTDLVLSGGNPTSPSGSAGNIELKKDGKMYIDGDEIYLRPADGSGGGSIIIDPSNTRIGIGCDPAMGLDMTSAARILTTSGDRPLLVTNGSGAASGGVEFAYHNLTQGIGFGYNTIYASGTNPHQSISLMPKGDSGVGVNISSPAYKFDCIGNSRFYGPMIIGDGVSSLALTVATPCGADTGGVQFMHGNETQGIGIGYNSIYAAGTVDHPINIMPGSNSGVGIGRTNPTCALHITSHTIYSTIRLETSDNGAYCEFGAINADGNTWVWNYKNSYMRLGTNNTERMRIAADGKVGIGTPSPAYDLDVNGVIRATGYVSVSGDGPWFGPGSGERLRCGSVGSPTKHIVEDDYSGPWWIGDYASAWRNCSILSSYAISASAYQCNSDRRAKGAVCDMPTGWAEEKINALRPVSYKWIDPRCGGGKRTCGFLAQEAETANIPGLVYNTTAMLHDGDYKTLKCEAVTPSSARLVPYKCAHALKNGTVRPGDSVELVLADDDIRLFTVKTYNEADGALEVKCSESEGEALKNADDITLIGHTVDDYKQLDTDALLAVVTRAVQELSQELAEVKAELHELKKAQQIPA